MAIAVEEICNEALGLIGMNPITSIDDTDVKSVRCKQFYETTRDAMLRRIPWNFAMGRVELVQSSTAPAFGYTYQYALPSDCIRLLIVATSATDIDSPSITISQVEYRVEGQFVLTDEEELYAKYTKRVIAPGLFDSMFVECLAAALAGKLAGPFTQSASLSSEMTKLTEYRLREARLVNARESGTSSVLDTDSWITARGGTSTIPDASIVYSTI